LAPALAAACLAGCTSQPASKALDEPAPRILGNYTLECDKQGGNECWVPLVITQDGPSCTVAYVFARIETPRNIKVIWYLNKAAGYEFDPVRGIDIKNNNGAFEGNGHHGGLKHQFTWRARAVGSGQQRQYDIVVKHSASGNACAFVDPIIFNRG
jgi:hypothetical protein